MFHLPVMMPMEEDILIVVLVGSVFIPGDITLFTGTAFVPDGALGVEGVGIVPAVVVM